MPSSDNAFWSVLRKFGQCKLRTLVKRCPIPVCLLGLLSLAGSGNTAAQELSIPMTTSDRVLSKGWWPTKGTEPRDQFVGVEPCAGCHKQIAETQGTTAMSHASVSAKSDSSDAGGPSSLRMGPYSYQIARTQDG